MNTVVTLTRHDDVAVITVDNPPVNALSHAVREGLDDAISRLNDDDELSAAVLICAGRTFIAGADIREFGKPPNEPFLPEVLVRLGRSAKPVVAAMHGTVLGGGFETALACHYRIAFPGTKVGLPEVTLGLIPGAGGTQLLPRLAGVDTALDMITSGKPVAVESERGRELVDEVVEGASYEELLDHGLAAARTLIAEGVRAQRLADVVIDRSSDHDELFATWRAKLAKKQRGLLAAQNGIDSVENAVLLPFADGVAEERRLFQECRESSQSRAMRHAFFAERSCTKVDGIDGSLKPLPVQRVAVIGAGTMGVGIAICFADAGMSVTLLELDREKVDAGLEKIRGNYKRSVTRGRITEAGMQERLGLVKGTTDYSDLGDVDLVVEAAFESMEVKNTIFTTLDDVCKPDAILATNTSYLNINEIAEVTGRRDKVIGMHFFSPAHIMKLLEVVRAEHTSDQTLLTTIALGKRLRKIPVTVGVCYGFAGNRIYARYGAEAQNLLLEGATPAQVDSAMRDWGMAMGPFEVIDLTGLDIGYKARKHQPDLPDDPTYFALSTVFVEAGRLGQKSGSGFYDYTTGARQEDSHAVGMIRDTAGRLGVAQHAFDADSIRHRLVSAIVDEGKAVLEEGIVQRASDIDVIWLNGYGFPRFRGGPMWYAEEEAP
ncbi:MAG: 3-hydroxyacyl-CoA dehydrogenase NAD-binding domain-containing protein [Pseudomonadota bacterium]